MQYQHYALNQRKFHSQQSIEDDGKSDCCYRQQGAMPVLEDVIAVSQTYQALDYASLYEADRREKHLPSDCC